MESPESPREARTRHESDDFSSGEFRGLVIEKLSNIECNLAKKVDHTEFGPVKSIVYGLVGVVMLAVITAIVATVVKAAF